MAFIRQYQLAGDLRYPYAAGDPGFGKWFKRAFKPPKALRKFQPGKAVKKLAGAAASFVPGIGGLAAQYLAGRAEQPYMPEVAPERPSFTAPEPDEFEDEGYDPLEELRRYVLQLYGLGDPGKGKRKTGPRKSARSAAAPPPKAKKRRKGAAAGPRAKAKAKATNRLGGFGRGALDLIKTLGPGALEAIMSSRGSKRVDPEAMLEDLGSTGILPGAGRGVRRLRLPGMGGARRRINPANVKALRRGIRRLDSFQKLVKSVEKAYPRMRAATRGSSAPRARGHRSGCACAVCRRAA